MTSCRFEAGNAVMSTCLQALLDWVACLLTLWSGGKPSR
jgi:hypothetical protein